MILAGASLLWAGAADAALISFIDHGSLAPVTATTDIGGATTSSSPLLGNLATGTVSVGNVTGPSIVLFADALIQPGTDAMTGGGKGVSDILEPLGYSSGATVVGFQAVYQSNEGHLGLPNPGFPTHPLFCSTAPGNEPPCGPNQPNSEIIKTGLLQTMFSGTETLPGDMPVDLIVNVQSPLQPLKQLSEPATLALFACGLIALVSLLRRRRRTA